MVKWLFSLASAVAFCSSAANATTFLDRSFYGDVVDDIEISAFDDLGGTRQLTKVEISVYIEAYFDFEVENLSSEIQNAGANFEAEFLVQSPELGMSNTITLKDNLSETLCPQGVGSCAGGYGDSAGFYLYDGDSTYMGFTAGLDRFLAPVTVSTQVSNSEINPASGATFRVSADTPYGDTFVDVYYTYENLAAAAVIPLPAGLPLLLAGMGALGIAGRRKQRPSQA